MNGKKILLTLLLIDFLATTVWALVEHGGYVTAMADLLASPVGKLATFDLVIALTIATVWMWRDATARRMNPLPYVVLTLLTGSAGPLLYLVRRR
ncbi:MAG: DUF2834 domain-containing protein [Myxococcales bacterium]|nr:DUF2834 domain-containing protein [Myxococcales bacterium]